MLSLGLLSPPLRKHRVKLCLQIGGGSGLGSNLPNQGGMAHLTWISNDLCGQSRGRADGNTG